MSYPIHPSQAPNQGGPYWPGTNGQCNSCGTRAPLVIVAGGGACCASCASGAPCEGDAAALGAPSPADEARALALQPHRRPCHRMMVDAGVCRAVAFVYEVGNGQLGIAAALTTARGERAQAYVEVDRELYARIVRTAHATGALPRLAEMLSSRGYVLDVEARPLLPR